MQEDLRRLITLLLLCVIAGIGYLIHWELGKPDRIEAQSRYASCKYAKRVANAQSDPAKYNALAAWAQKTCLGVDVP